MKAALVGCGHIAETHWRALRQLSGVEVVGVADREVERAAAFSRAHTIEHASGSLTELIETARPDVVHVLTPPPTHADLSTQAMEAGCHVLVEKPMASSTAECERMSAVAERTGLHLGVCHNFRFVPAFQEAVALRDDGRLGAVRSVEIYWRTTYSPESRGRAGAWIQNLRGGIFHEVAPHLVYLAQVFASDLRLSSCTVAEVDGDPSELRALLESSVGPVVLGISTGTSPVQKIVRIRGSSMSLDVDLATSVLLRLRGRPDGLSARAKVNLELAGQLLWGTVSNAVRVSTGRLPRGHETLIRRYYDAVRQGESPPASHRQGRAVVSVLEQLWRALEAERDRS